MLELKNEKFIRMRDTHLSQLFKKISFLILFISIIGCSSGGGGGGSSSSGGGGGTDYTAACSRQGSTYSGCYPARQTESSYETTEYNKNYGLGDINGSSAYSRELSGAGVKVAVVDSGIDTTHSEFTGKTMTGYNYETNNTTLNDGHAHGTHVAGIIAARRDGDDAAGVAWGVTDLYIYKILDDANGSTAGTGSVNTLISDVATRAIAADVQVANHSYGFSAAITSVTTSYLNTVYNGMVTGYKSMASDQIINVVSTGNNTSTQPQIIAGLPYRYSELKEYWIAVTSVDTDGKSAHDADYCGVAAAYCISAPGEGIWAPGSNEKYGGNVSVKFDGTSMAAPHVTGAIAILIEAFPTLTPAQIVDRLLTTASTSGLTDRAGNSYSAAVHGVGMVDLDAATKPIEVLALSVGGSSISTSTRYSLDSTRLRLSKAFGESRILNNNTFKEINNLSKQIAKTQSIASFDTYDNAAFFLNLSSLTTDSTYTPLNLNKMILKDYKEQSLYDFGILKLYGIVDSTNTKTDQYNFPFKTLRATISLNDYFAVKYNYAELQDFFFLSTRKDLRITESLFTYDAFKNPYMGMSGEFEGVEIFLNLNDKLKLSFNYNEEGYVQELETIISERKKNITLKGFNAYLDSIKLGKMKLSYARMQEEGAFLGSQTSGAFKLKDSSITDIFGAIIEKKIDSNMTIYASGFYGSTKVTPSIDSLFTDFETIQSTSWSLGLLNDRVVRENDSFGLVLHQPIKAENGKFNLRLPHYADYNGIIFYKDEIYSLKPNGREINYEAFYQIDINKIKIRLSSIFIDEGGHLKESSLEKVFMLELKGAI